LTTKLPRVNFLGIIGGVLALVSILFPWWGIRATGFGISTSSMWGFFGGPSHNPDINNASGFSNTITTYSPIILALALLSMALAIAGSFTPRVRILAGSLVTSVAALVGYAELIGQQLSRNGLHHSADRFRNNIWSNPHLGLPTRILHLHSSNNPSARRNGIPSNPYPASLQRSDLQSEGMILC